MITKSIDSLPRVASKTNIDHFKVVLVVFQSQTVVSIK